MNAPREALVAAVRDLDRRGLNYGSTGNVSVRVEGGLLVTPTGIAADRMDAGDIVMLAADGTPAPGQRAPTSEWRLHVSVLAARADAGAAVHTHSPEATAVACRREAIEAIHYAVARTGGPTVPCAPYATYGTAALSSAVVETLGDCGRACLMANHGMVALGAELDEAVALAVEVEWLARIWRLARTGDGRAVVLDEAEVARVAERFASYGQGSE